MESLTFLSCSDVKTKSYETDLLWWCQTALENTPLQAVQIEFISMLDSEETPKINLSFDSIVQYIKSAKHQQLQVAEHRSR